MTNSLNLAPLASDYVVGNATAELREIGRFENPVSLEEITTELLIHAGGNAQHIAQCMNWAFQILDHEKWLSPSQAIDAAMVFYFG